MEYLSKSQMLDWAEQAGYERDQALDQLFEDWIQIGVVGSMTAGPDRSCEGLWHPVQRSLWLMALSDRARGERLSTIINAPIGLWVLGWQGMELQQAQRALYFFVRQQPLPVVKRDEPHQALESMDNTGSRLRPFFEQLLEGVPHLTAAQDPQVDRLFEALIEGSEPALEAKSLVQGAYEQFRLIFRAAREIDALCQRDGVAALWAWAQRRCQRELGEYGRKLPELQANPDVGKLFEELSFAHILANAGSMVLLLFGMALEILDGHPVPRGFEVPPDIRSAMQGQ